MNEVAQVLSACFGFKELRPGQQDVIDDVLAGKKVISVMPTGAGKSLCYQLPAVVLAKQNGFTLVVSPLIALMKDQVDSLRQRSVRTAALTSAANAAEQTEILQGIRTGAFDIIYVAPERFRSGRFMSALNDVRDKLALLAIDEAHCISEWGHDFRPAYRTLGQVISTLQPPRVLAVTATATPEVRTDIAQQLGVSAATMHVRGFARPELCFSVEHCGGAKDKCARIIEKVSKVSEGSALVYAATRKNAELYASELSAANIQARAYHAGLEDLHRVAIQDEFMSGDIKVIVATNAFGMGVDKTDVRLVIHADLPRSLEAYYQEAGRGGRDGKDATCVVLFNHGDVRLQEFLIDASFPSAEVLRTLWKTLRSRPGLSHQDLGGLSLPGDPHDSTVSSAVRILARHGYLHDDMGSLMAVSPKEIRGDYPEFDPEASSRRADVERSKLRQIMDYCYHTGCRHGFVLDYFGEQRAENPGPCDGCDNCQGFGQGEALSETQLAQAESLLALVGELQGRFGRKRIAGIAVGSDDDERFYGLQNRSFMAGSTQKAVQELLRSLEAGGLIQQSRGEYPTLQLSRTGKQIVQGQAKLDEDLLKVIRTTKTQASRSKKKPAATRAPLSQSDQEVLVKLRRLRTELAQERSVPAYVIFSNRSLEELAIIKPSSHSELNEVHGFGPARIENYGDQIIAALR